MLRLGTSALALAAVAVLSTGCIITTDDGDSDLTIFNESNYYLIQIQLAEVNDRTWGPNLLGRDDLPPGGSLTIVDIECGRYDVLIVDELGTACELIDLGLCFDSADWFITDATLDSCDW